MVGTALVTLLEQEGHTIGRLVRRRADRTKAEVYWDPNRGSLDKDPLANFGPEAVIHLAGENIAQGRWTEAKKARIRDSRIKGTRVLAECLASLETPPKVLICASAIGFYGSRGEEILKEESSQGDNFLARVCAEWEAAAQPARDRGIRVVTIRTGVVLSPGGGALKKMLLPFKMGLGGVIGNGRQYFSWITLDDLVGVFQFALKEEKVSGPYNATAPFPVTNRVFTKTLGRVLWRPTLFSIPASTARMVFGEMADEMLLASARVDSSKLAAAGFSFQYPHLKEALKHVLGK